MLYSAPVTIAQTTTLTAVALKDGLAASPAATAVYVIAPAGGGGLNPALPPSGNFDLSLWKLTIPNGNDISRTTLNAGYTLADAFFTDPVSGGMVFRCPNIAGTTSGSTYSRSELREMLNESAGTTNLGNNWVLGSSSAAARAAAAGVDGTQRATLSVDHVSTTGDAAKVGRVIVGQIHGPDTEIIRLYFHKRPGDARGAIYFGHDTPSNSNSYHAIIGDPDNLDPANGIALGERWSYEINVTGRLLTVRVTPASGVTATSALAIEPGYDDLYLYYKAGVYNQNNTGDSTDYVQATFYSLTHTHP
jgi:poly(beta-D-mannuronate) lyase